MFTRYSVKILAISLVFCFTIGWFSKTSVHAIFIPLLFTINTAILLSFFYNKKERSIKYYLFTFLLLVIFQTTTTNIKNTYTFTPSQIDQQIQRMNYYPPNQARLGYIMEHKKEIQYANIFIGNFTDTIDFNTYFPDYFSFAALPFFFVGLYLFVNENLEKERRVKMLLTDYCLMFTVVFLSLMGVHGKYGPFLIFPFIVLFIYIGIQRVCFLLFKNWDLFRI